MTLDEKQKFKALIASVYELYRKLDMLTPTTMTLWFNALEGYALPVISAALSQHARNPDTGMFIPLPADVVKLIEGGSEDVGLIAWGKVDRAVRSIGPWRTVIFDDPLIHYAIVQLGGWQKVCAFTDEDWKFQRQPFVTLYKGARQRQIEFPAKLLGIAEATNGEKHREAPYLIGDEAKCRHVLATGAALPALEMRPARDLIPRLPNTEARA